MIIVLKTINENDNIIYQSFMSDEDKPFNFLANTYSEKPLVLSTGQSGMLLINELGLIIEIELLFIKAFIEGYPSIECSNNKEGVPFFTIESNTLQNEPYLYIDKTNQKALIFFESRRPPISLIVHCKNTRFLINDNKLLGIESTNIIFDTDGELQKKWLEKYSLV